MKVFHSGPILLLFILHGIAGSAQREVELTLRDSVILDCTPVGTFKGMTGYYGPVLKKGGNYYAFEHEMSRLHVFSSDGSCERHYGLKSEGGRSFDAMGFDVTDDVHYFSRFNTLTRTKPDGATIAQGALGWEEEFGFAQRLYSYPPLKVVEERGQLIIPVKASLENSSSHQNAYKAGDRYFELYEDGGLLAVYPLSSLDAEKGGAPDHYVGQMAPIYEEKPHLLHLDHSFWSMNEKSGCYFLGQMATPNIRVYDKEGELLREFGERGEHLTEADTLHRIQEVPQSNDVRWVMERKKQVLSPSYTRTLYDSAHRVSFRTYKAYSDEKKEEMRRWEDLSKHEWYRIQVRKPSFLQVYDHANGDRLILDRPIKKRPFRLIAVDEHTLYVEGGYEEGPQGKRIKVYEYDLTVE